MKNEDILTSLGVIASNPFMYSTFRRGMNNFLLDMAANKQMTEAIMNVVVQFCLEFNRRSFEETNIKADLFLT